ncbi:GTP-binding protein 1-like [Tropilaelaps mercedesae]|uniref:GTP-binding protein 1 n=1 Tax=Tropilaelaps mercedesae TaxID=418985 RepID=A0A1V9XIG8_9ACAR|nr:GTP-binding protein 1-like [Tropilaelaps mercedesae]
MSAILDETKGSTGSVEFFQSPVENEPPPLEGLLEKTALVSPSEKQYDALCKDLQKRLKRGHGETIYEVGKGAAEGGLTPEELEASVATLGSMADTQECDCVQLRCRKEASGQVAEFLVRRRPQNDDFQEVRVAVVGNVDAGKSTLLGVLTHGELDNGRGFARQKLFRHKHEMESGRTSSVGNDILGFDSLGNVVNKPDAHAGQLDWMKICEESSKVITFIDLAGHERYLKTTIFGMTGHAPDFTMLMVGANAGIVGMTKEHLGLALALSVPVFVVVTKIDMCPTNVLQDTMRLLVKILKSPGCRKIPVIVHSPDDVVVCATNFVSERLCPIFKVSNVTGANLPLLRTFMNLLTTRMPGYLDDEPCEFQIDDTYSVPGVGTVVSGTTLKGVVRLNETLLLGPDLLGRFSPVQIKSIHRKRMPVHAGQTASFALKKQVRRSDIRKGMVLLSQNIVDPQSCWEFEGEILVLHHPTTISPRYQAMVHCGSIRQTATIVQMSTECLRTGDKALVHFRFIKNPEYVRPGMRMVFREGRTKAVGNVLRVLVSPGGPGAAGGKKPHHHPAKIQRGHHRGHQKPIQDTAGSQDQATRSQLQQTTSTNGDSTTTTRIDTS